MKLQTLFDQKKVVFSLEIFPPKKTASIQTIYDTLDALSDVSPDFISVTYGAGGGTSKYTLDIAKNIKDQYNVQTLAHLTCVSSTRETVHQKIKEIKAAGIENIMALRGDIPADMDLSHQETWAYHHAIDLIRELRESGTDFCIGGACYPEKHPESANQKEDIRFLKEKVDAGCEFLTTQMFFDNNLLYNFLYKIREAGITVPVVAGIMPITNANQIDRALKLSGSHVPQRFKALVDKFGSDPAAMKQAGIAYATDQIIDLFANNVTNVHVYSMNKPDVARKIQSNLSDMLGK